MAAIFEGWRRRRQRRAVERLLFGVADGSTTSESLVAFVERNGSSVDLLTSVCGDDVSGTLAPAALETLLRGTAAGYTHHGDLAGFTAIVGEAAIPHLTATLRADPNGPMGRAAVMALRDLPPAVALPLVVEAMTSTWPAVRYYAADYLCGHSSAQTREIAIDCISREPDENVKSVLRVVIR